MRTKPKNNIRHYNYSDTEETPNPQMNTAKITAKIVLGLTLVFLISYVNYHAFRTHVYSVNQKSHEDKNKITIEEYYNLQYMYLISTFLLLINSCLNPVALLCTSRVFRRHFKHYLTCCCKTKSPYTELELTRRN
jgi:NADH:ubiquinone oxidoreductase subunit 4 (subunit M)